MSAADPTMPAPTLDLENDARIAGALRWLKMAGEREAGKRNWHDALPLANALGGMKVLIAEVERLRASASASSVPVLSEEQRKAISYAADILAHFDNGDDEARVEDIKQAAILRSLLSVPVQQTEGEGE
jgi:hypothetical protein